VQLSVQLLASQAFTLSKQMTCFMKLLALTIIAFTFFQCTIEKRIHQKGYHVTWNTNKYADPKATKETVFVAKEIDTTTPRKILLKEEITYPTLPLDNQPKKISETKTLENSNPTDTLENEFKGEGLDLAPDSKVDNQLLGSISHNYPKLRDVLTVNEANGKLVYSKSKTLLKDNDKSIKGIETTENQPIKVEKMGLYAFFTGFVVIATICMLVFLDLSSYLTLILIVFGMIIPMILMFILSILSLRIINNEPNAYKFKGLSITLALLALITSFIGLLSFAILGLYLAEII
jgi:hypothetical protein